MALSVKLALSESPRPLAGMLPYGDRTFLPLGAASDCPSGKLRFYYRESEDETASDFIRNKKHFWRISTALLYSGHSGCLSRVV